MFSSMTTPSFEHLNEYIRSISDIPKADSGLEQGVFPFITISRQAGAGGHTLAAAILKELDKKKDQDRLYRGWQILDQELCGKMMDDPQLKYPMQWLLTERFEREFVDYLSQIVAGTSPQIAVYHKIAKTIRTFVTLGKVIVVGRAGSFLTKDLPMGVHARLVASKSFRVQNMMRLFNLREGEAENAVQEQDASRALLVKTCFSKADIGDPLNYDMVWNTERVPIPAIASILVNLVGEKAEHKLTKA